MFSLNQLLKYIASQLIIKSGSDEHSKIENSINFIKRNLNSYFRDEIKGTQIFGSFIRSTNLSRKYDDYSDVDLLIIFNVDSDRFLPETYINKLKKFAEKYYSNSITYKSHPTTVIELNHINFDLVPTFIDGLLYDNVYIPDRYNRWQKTDPFVFSENLTVVNKKYGYIAKPIIRLMKLWNASCGHPFESFLLEQQISKMNFQNDNYESGFIYAVENINENFLSLQKKQKVSSLRNHVDYIIRYTNELNFDKMYEHMSKIFPMDLLSKS